MILSLLEHLFLNSQCNRSSHIIVLFPVSIIRTLVSLSSTFQTQPCTRFPAWSCIHLNPALSDKVSTITLSVFRPANVLLPCTIKSFPATSWQDMPANRPFRPMDDSLWVAMAMAMSFFGNGSDTRFCKSIVRIPTDRLFAASGIHSSHPPFLLVDGMVLSKYGNNNTKNTLYVESTIHDNETT